MSFEPVLWSPPFTTLETLAIVWVLVAIAAGSFVLARRMVRRPVSVRTTLGAGLLLLVSVVFSLGLVAWMFNHHV